MKLIRRFRVLTYTGVQIRLAAVFGILYLIFMCLLASVFFFNFADVSLDANGLPIHDRLVTEMLLVRQAKQLALWYGLVIGGFLFVSMIFIVVYSHRITGPIYKLEKILEKALEEKKLPAPFKFRKGDAFHSLAHTFNRFIHEVCGK